MGHFAPTGMAGLDLYVRDGQGQWRFLGIGKPSLEDRTSVQMASGLHPGRHEYMLYLPLYVGVETLRLGIEPGRSIGPLPPRTGKPIVFYGTSIVQGGCASRAGMCYTAILGRRLDQPVVNLGFSGNGQMEIEIAGLLAELDPRVFVIDALPNVTPPQATDRGEPFLRRLCTARPQTPVVVVENITYTNSFLKKELSDNITTKNAAIRRVCDTLRREGFDNLQLVEAGGILGDDGEAAVDGVHPTDVGFLRMADALEPVLRPLV
jgi:lysophospholipase L1-like esterase